MESTFRTSCSSQGRVARMFLMLVCRFYLVTFEKPLANLTKGNITLFSVFSMVSHLAPQCNTVAVSSLLPLYCHYFTTRVFLQPTWIRILPHLCEHTHVLFRALPMCLDTYLLGGIRQGWGSSWEGASTITPSYSSFPGPSHQEWPTVLWKALVMQ